MAAFMPEYIDISVSTVSSRKALVDWNCPQLYEYPSQSYMVCTDLKGNIIYNGTHDGAKRAVTIQGLTPGETYRVEVTCFDSGSEQEFSDSISFHTVYSTCELQQLLKRAEQFQSQQGNNFRALTYFYRDNPYHHYQYITSKKKQREKAHPKAISGDPACPLNENLNGLFFNGRLREDGNMEEYSDFGDTRFYLTVDKLFKTSHNLYFADFYCMYQTHYVCLVITLPETQADDFCRDNLVKLNNRNNLFLYIDIFNDVIMNHSSVRIEIFYSASVNMKSGNFMPVQISPHGITPGGIMKPRECDICNVYSPQGQQLPCLTQATSEPQPSLSQATSEPQPSLSQGSWD